MPTLHILSNPTGPVHILNRTDPFSIAVIKFIDNMQLLGWNCIHYGISGCEVNCETVICLNTIYENRNACIDTYNRKAASEIKSRKKAGDMIMCFHGWENRVAAEANSDLPIVEPSIGYDTKAVFAPYRAFVSYAQMHLFYGERGMLMTPSWFDAVIPNAFSPNEFEFSSTKKDYILYFGRVIENKGLNIAIQATKQSGHKLIVAGPGSLADMGYTEVPNHVQEFGVANAEQRKILMRDATAIIGPTYYVEPFGNMVAEGQFSGTPSITTDWGGFIDTVIHGTTGFRCREFKDFVNALKNIDQISPQVCRDWAMTHYTEDIVHKQFDEYFKKILTKNFYRE
jgi:glycosyltransferase involved in cell wall biosynthesis